MKGWGCVAIVLVLSASANAQQQASPSSIGLPLPPIGLPLPVIGLQPLPEPVTTVTPPSTNPDGERHRRHGPTILIFGAPYAFGYETWQQSTTPGVIAQPPAIDLEPMPSVAADTGRLELLQMKPADAQLFVDGEFVGTWSDHDGILDLPAGTHRIEIRAPGYEALSFDVRIGAGRTITYRGALTRIEAPSRPPSGTPPAAKPPAAQQPIGPDAKTPPAPRVGRTIYLIPGCYLGNVPPEEVKLPAGCDLSRVITNKPQ